MDSGCFVMNDLSNKKCILCVLMTILTATNALYSIQHGRQLPSAPQQQMALITTGNNPKPPLRMNAAGTPADYSHKVSVRVSDVLTRQKAAEADSYQRFKPSVTQSFTRPHSTQLMNNPSSMTQIVVRPNQPQSPPSNALILPMANSHSVIKEDRSWPPEHSQEFARVDVRVMGEKIDNEALLHLRPSSTAASVRKLRKILGPEMQTDWMRIDPPPKESNKAPRSIMTMPKAEARLVSAVDGLNFTVLRPAMNGAQEAVPVRMTEEQISMVKDWLIQKATCNMDYLWEDLGPLFWPRWIRRGICVNNSPCSWPPGMRCRPSGSRSLKLLRWVCSNDTPQKRRRRTYQSQFYRRLRRDGEQQGSRRRTTREDRRSRRVRRLIRKLSLTANGYHCEWSRHEYMVSDQCTCGCDWGSDRRIR